MTKAFILVDAEISKIEDVSKELEKSDLEVYSLFGNHDFIVTTEFGDSKATATNLPEKIHPMEGIIRTKTLIGSDIKSEQT